VQGEHERPNAWDAYIPNAALYADILPPSAAPWSELVFFAGTFDGYRLQHGVANAAPVLDSAMRRFRTAGELPDAKAAVGSGEPVNGLLLLVS
jgi:hypothetical protein